MSNYNNLIADNINYALEPNIYLENLKKESDKEKRTNILKKYFSENITKNFYQNMDLLYAADANFDQFKNIYGMVAKNLFMNVLLAVDTLVAERKTYDLNKTKINIDDVILFCSENNADSDEESGTTQSEYSICESHIDRKSELESEKLYS